MLSEVEFLGGGVVKRTLPLLSLPLAPGASSLKRLSLAQGELAQFHDGDEGMRYLAFIELLPGQVRGNHYHKVKVELVYMVRGEAALTVVDLKSAARAELTLRTGEVAMIRTGIAHAFRPIELGYAIEYSSSRFDPADIHRFAVV
jgi:mannose-6-phosphate isomerase-like protein (cupin superfamily)